MKKLLNSVSPFIMLLIPIFFGLALVAFNANAETRTERFRAKANCTLKMPTLKNMIEAIL
jgi:hypothetical protein